MLNKIIKLDLHIHSNASKYKEVDNIVDQSTKENLDVLFEKLCENKINLFSITDHNRFDSELYLKAKEKINSGSYPEVKEILAGIEFDVQFEKEKKPCHIITIFNVTEHENDFKKIENVINENFLKDKEAFYSKEKFEDLLKSIGLDVILIACQRKSLDNSKGNHNSLSDTTEDPYVYLKVGYINALEYQKPNVQGILIKNLKNFNRSVGLITGSDCHDWSVYPSHDKSQLKTSMYYSSIKMLPSFKGLLMAITSPTTRFNRSEINNSSFIKSIMINGDEHHFDNGINAIIGENGSGKTTLIKHITNTARELYAKKLIKKNGVEISNSIDYSKTKIIQQAEIINKFNKNELFKDEDNELFFEIDYSDFEIAISCYALELMKYISSNIKSKKLAEDIDQHNITIIPELEDSTYFISATYPKDFAKNTNKHEERRSKLLKIHRQLNSEEKENYYNSHQNRLLKEALKNVAMVFKQVDTEYKATKRYNEISNIIVDKINLYNGSISELKNSEDRDKSKYQVQKANIKDIVISVIKDKRKQNTLDDFPKPLEGMTSNETNGFIFKKVAEYNNLNLKQEFYKVIFNKDYADESIIRSIDTIEALYTAIKGADNSNYEIKYNDNVAKFIGKYKTTRSYILDFATRDNIGNTLGEISLVYYKYQTFNNDDWDLLIVDQPEDHISNNKISTELIKHLNNLRYMSNKQIIFVTHSPLLVVNLDADNVLYLEKTNEKISITSGCLEDERNAILDIIAKNMDGGKDKIEKRLSLYGKDN